MSGGNCTNSIVITEEEIKEIIASGADLNIKDKTEETLLIKLVRLTNHTNLSHFKKLIKLVLYAGADPNIGDKKGHTALNFASENILPSIVKLLLKFKADPNNHHNNIRPLDISVFKESPEITQMLLAAGADPNVKDLAGMTPIWFSFVYSDSLNNCRILVNGGARLDVIWEEDSLINTLVRDERINELELALELGADVNFNDDYGDRALHKACYNNNTKAMEILLEARANPNDFNYQDQTPLSITLMQRNVEGSKLLLSSGANPNIINSHNECVYHLMTSNVDEELFNMLFKSSADINQKNDVGDTPLHIAAKEGRFDLAKILLKYGANPFISNNAGITVRDFKLFKCNLTRLFKFHPRVVSLRTLCLRVIIKDNVNTEVCPPSILLFPDDSKENELYIERQGLK